MLQETSVAKYFYTVFFNLTCTVATTREGDDVIKCDNIHNKDNRYSAIRFTTLYA